MYCIIVAVMVSAASRTDPVCIVIVASTNLRKYSERRLFVREISVEKVNKPSVRNVFVDLFVIYFAAYGLMPCFLIYGQGMSTHTVCSFSYILSSVTVPTMRLLPLSFFAMCTVMELSCAVSSISPI